MKNASRSAWHHISAGHLELALRREKTFASRAGGLTALITQCRESGGAKCGNPLCQNPFQPKKKHTPINNTARPPVPGKH
jgi:hypothetical protein